jgi:phosphatidylserine/phosphatidylglycerophosphate/cardiolipin synthase-like enzyme
MSRRRKSSRTNSTATIASLVILIVLGIIYTLTGKNPSDVFTPDDQTTVIPVLTVTSPAPELATAGNAPTAVNASGTWWEVYFTDPIHTNDPNNWQSSIEGRLIEKINGAQKSIHIVSFEFDLTPVAQALIAARQRGVDVRWVTDDENGLAADEDPDRGQFAMLKNAGIEVRADSRTALMHNKFWIFDGETAWTGSTNITVSGIFQQNNNAIVIHSPEVAAIYEREFQEMWDGQFGPKSPSTADQQSVTLNGTPIQIYFSPEDKVMDRIIPIVSSAQSNIRFMAFSFTDYPLAKAIIDRAAAGVDAAGVYEKVGSETEGSEMKTFFCARVPVRQDGNPRFLHDKIIILDNHIVISGSFNFSSNATENNDENVIIIDNPDIASLYMQEFARLWSIATNLDPAKVACS